MVLTNLLKIAKENRYQTIITKEIQMTQENFKQAVENIENKHQVKLIFEANGCKSFYPTDDDECKIDAPECEKGW
ncbi:hypothetical protein AA974_05760 [Helicobacter pylori]|nr:hypothetical protein AA974_05760 [Helicobacter pylori]